MEEVIEFTPDALLELMSYMDPWKLGEYLRVNKGITGTVLKPESLSKLAEDRKLPYKKGITLKDLCDYYKMKIEGTLSSHMASIGWLEAVELTMSSDGSDYGNIITNASEQLLNDIIQIVIDNAKENNVPLFFVLSYDGNLKAIVSVAEYIGKIDKMTQKARLNEFLRGAAASGRKGHMIAYLNNGADDYNGAYLAIAEEIEHEDHFDMSGILKTYDTNKTIDFKQAVELSANSGNFIIFSQSFFENKDLTKSDIKSLLFKAINAESKNIVHSLLEYIFGYGIDENTVDELYSLIRDTEYKKEVIDSLLESIAKRRPEKL